MPAPRRPLTIPKYAGALFKMLVFFTVLLLAAYFGLMAMSPKARQWANGKDGPTPFKFINQILAIPAQAIGKTNDVVATNNARVGVLDKVITEEEAKNKAARPVIDPFSSPTPATTGSSAPGTAAAAPASDEPAAVSAQALIALNEKAANPPDNPGTDPGSTDGKATGDAAGPDSTPAPGTPAAIIPPPKDSGPLTQVKLGGGIIIANASPAGSPAASQSFLYWVVNLNITGVFQSTPPRILMNNRLIYEHQEVSMTFGITFDHLDLARKLIVFRDQSGAVVTRSY